MCMICAVGITMHTPCDHYVCVKCFAKHLPRLICPLCRRDLAPWMRAIGFQVIDQKLEAAHWAARVEAMSFGRTQKSSKA
jgi:hypothetical protein